jgi:hypothetical protein
MWTMSFYITACLGSAWSPPTVGLMPSTSSPHPDVVSELAFGDGTVADDVARARLLTDDQMAVLLAEVISGKLDGRWVTVTSVGPQVVVQEG